MRDKDRRRAHAPRAIAETVDRLTRPHFAKRGFAAGAIVREWPLIVGEALARQTLPERIAYPPGMRIDGTLHLRVGSGSLAAELQHLEPVLLERICGYFGYPAVSRIRYLQRPLPPRRPGPRPAVAPLDAAAEGRLRESLSTVGDPALGQALTDLGRAVLGRTRRS